MARRYNLLTGPNVDGMTMSLKDTRTSHRLTVDFRTEDGMKLEVVVNGLEREEGSGCCWLFKGYEVSGKKWVPVNGFIDTKNRKGFIVIDFQPKYQMHCWWFDRGGNR